MDFKEMFIDMKELSSKNERIMPYNKKMAPGDLVMGLVTLPPQTKIEITKSNKVGKMNTLDGTVSYNEVLIMSFQKIIIDGREDEDLTEFIYVKNPIFNKRMFIVTTQEARKQFLYGFNNVIKSKLK